MKRITAILLALLMLLGLTTTAFAEDTTSITIEGSAGRTYAGYQLLELTTSLKGDTHHPANCDKVNHSDDCYNYAYTVNNAYREVLQNEVFNYGGNYLWEGSGKPGNASLITDDQILKYFANQTSGEGTMRQVADRIYRAIVAKNIEADAKALTGTNDSIHQGYWMFADVSELDGNEANSLVMVDTAGEQAITIQSKTALPTVEKKVKDIDDSEDSNILDNYWYDSADHDVGDTVPFKLTATLPSNAKSYASYQLIFHDAMSSGLTLNAESIKVYMYETKHKADADTDLNDAKKDVTANFVTKTEGLDDGCTFEVSCENVLAIDDVTKDTAFVVYYEATLNEAAVVGAAGNPNEVHLEFSNNPYGDGTGETADDKVVVFTYQVTVNKTDSHGHDLEGAGFTLYKKYLGSEDEYVQIGEELKGDAMTTFNWKGLDDGDYKLVETTVPEGYNEMEDIVFAISATHSETADEPQLISLDGGQMGAGDVTTGIIAKDIVNHTGTVLPETGAKGTIMLITVSVMFVGVAAIFMITRKKMSIYED